MGLLLTLVNIDIALLQTEALIVNDGNLCTLLSELKNEKCSCNLHYSVIIDRLKEYLTECKQLEIEKLLKAATDKVFHFYNTSV